jgi:hypothetical protein
MATHEVEDLASTTSNELELGQTAPLEPDSVSQPTSRPHGACAYGPQNIDTGSDFDDGDSAIESVSELPRTACHPSAYLSCDYQLGSSTASIRDELIKEVREHGRQYQGYMEASKSSVQFPYRVKLSALLFSRITHSCVPSRTATPWTCGARILSDYADYCSPWKCIVNYIYLHFTQHHLLYPRSFSTSHLVLRTILTITNRICTSNGRGNSAILYRLDFQTDVSFIGRTGAIRCVASTCRYNITDHVDFQHHIVWLTLDQKLNLAPIKHVNRALDAGCGTGIWAIDFGTIHLLSDAQQLTS